MEKDKWITIIGCGPGAPDYITPAARQACLAAKVALGSARTLALFPEFCGERIIMSSNVQEALDAAEKITGARRLAVLVTGDPGLFSLAASFIRWFGREACDIIPGISSVQIAFARLGLDWANAEILSAHHEKPRVDVQCLRRRDKIALLAGKKESFNWIADICEKLHEQYSIFICEDLTLETENVRRVDAFTLRSGGYSSRTVVLIIRSDQLQ